MPRIRLALIDDHKIVRDGLKALLSTLESCTVIAEGGDGHDAVALAHDPDIDLFLMDIAMPGLHGLDATEQILTRNPDARIIILSMHATEDYVQQAMSRGARGYILKSLGAEELEQAILTVAAGGEYLGASVRSELDDVVSGGTAAIELLTQRQREVLKALADGGTTREIAEQLAISVKTVETHRSQLMEKLGIHDVPGLVRFAVRHGLVTVE